ncbi:MAG: hypothetical protein MK078_10145 [Crocinitomicaceae bacterium]|nr:hypothetical protein [Crocinitomicaceae bacterium]
MKYFLFFIPFLILACGNEVAETIESENHKQASADTSNVTLVEEIIPSLEVETINNDLTAMYLSGDIESVSIHTFQVDDEGEEIGMGGSYEYYSFNVNGMITQLEIAGCCGTDSEMWEYIYNDGDYLTHRKRYLDSDYDDEYEEFMEKEKYFYNSDSILVKIKFAGEDKELTKETSFEYDDEGRIEIELTEYTSDDSYEERSYFYGPDYTTENVSGSDESMNYSSTEYYSENGMIIREEKTLSVGNMITKYEYKLDDRGNWIERTSRYKYESEENWNPSTTVTRSIKYRN